MLFVITSFVPVALILFGPLMWFISAVTPWKGFCIATVRRHTGRYTTLHLSVYDRVGHLSPRRAARFHRSFLTTLLRAVETGKRP